MSSILVNGTIDNPEPIRSYEEPPTPYNGGMIAGGTLSQIALPGFKNTGNVPLTLTVNVVDIIGVTVTAVALEVGGNQFTNQVTLNPGFSATLRVNLRAPETGPGDDTSYSFDLETNWA